MKLDPIIAVKDVKASSVWYQSVFNCRSIHGGDTFDVLIDDQGDVLLCLHKWGEHDHPSMKSPKIQPGNGLMLYFRTPFVETIRRNIRDSGYAVESELRPNPNSGKKEFSLKDPDGYYLTISDYHEYKG